MHEAINRFESDLRKAVRRGSKSSEFDEQIQEVISHFSDLYLHQLELGKHQDKAEELARSTLGSLPRVAHQILNNSSRRGRGVCIQKSMFWVPAVAALLFIGLQWHSVPLISHLFFTFEKVLGIAFVVCGLRFGYGIHLARKLIWKHLLATFAVTAAILTGFYYDGSRGDGPLDGMNRAEITRVASRYHEVSSKVGQDKRALYLLDGFSPKTFNERYRKAAVLIEKSQTGQFSVEPGSVGTYYIPTAIHNKKDLLYPKTLVLGRTENAFVAASAWQILGHDFGQAISQTESKIARYQFYIYYKPLPIWYVIYGGLMVSAVFFGAFLAAAFASSIWSMRRVLGPNWLRLSRG